jgi:hypothetical protein
LEALAVYVIDVPSEEISTIVWLLVIAPANVIVAVAAWVASKDPEDLSKTLN